MEPKSDFDKGGKLQLWTRAEGTYQMTQGSRITSETIEGAH